MQIEFENPKHERLANDYDALCKKYDKNGHENGLDIRIALDALSNADTLADVPPIPFHPHPLQGSYRGRFSIWVTKTHRVIFRPAPTDDPAFRIDNFKTISSVIVEEIFINYHPK